MSSGLQKFAFSLATLFLGAGLTVSSAFAGSKAETFTGQHMMPGDAAGCTRACVGKGSKYALVVGDKVYTLESKDKAALEQLDKLAGQPATVSGKATGDTIEVTSVARGK